MFICLDIVLFIIIFPRRDFRTLIEDIFHGTQIRRKKNKRLCQSYEQCLIFFIKQKRFLTFIKKPICKYYEKSKGHCIYNYFDRRLANKY